MTNLPQNLSAVQSMNSLQIAELVNARHDSVKRTIERLADQEAIQLPPLVKVENEKSLSNNKMVDCYVFSGEQGKLDSITVVAQLCPLFTARMVKRWQELENQVAQGMLTTNDPLTSIAHNMQILATATQATLAKLDHTERYINLLELNQKGNIKVTPEVIEQVKLMKSQGYSQANIARMLRLSGATVSLIVNDKYPMTAVTSDKNITRLINTAKSVLEQGE